MADDIKIKLGLDATDLITGLSKATAEVNKLNTASDSAQKELNQLDGQEISINTSPAKQALDDLEQSAKQSGDGIMNQLKGAMSGSNLGAGLVGGLAGAGVAVAIDGVKALGSKLYEGALAADDFGDKLEVAFNQQGIKDVDAEIEKVRGNTLQLANDLGMPTSRTRELAGTVATLGGVSGKQAEDLTKLSAGLETFTDGAVKGEAVAKAFSRGLADPEGAAAIESLSKKYPQLAEALKSNLDPAQKLELANKALGSSFDAVKSQQSDAGGTLNMLSNYANEAFQSIGSSLYDIVNEIVPIFMDGFKEISLVFNEVFGSTQGSTADFMAAIKSVAKIVVEVLVASFIQLMNIVGPVINFIVNNFNTLAPIIGIAAGAFAAYNLVVSLGTAITAAYTAVQTALGGSISIATVAQYAWNLAMSLNPIGAVIAAVALLGAGVYALSDALSMSSKETREQAEENVKLIETQKDANAEQTKAVQSTKTMADEYLALSKKKKLTAEETKKLQGLTKDLSAEYPDLVKNTSNYKDNLDGVESIANRAGTSLKGLAEESAKLDKALLAANQTLSFAKRNEAIDEAISTTKTFGVVTDTYGRDAINAFAKALYAADTQDKATDAYTKATRELASNAKALSAVQSAYNAQIAALNAYKKTAESVVEVNKELTSTTDKTGKGKPVGASSVSQYDEAVKIYQSYLKGIEVSRKEAIETWEAQGLSKEEIQIKLAEDPNLAPKGEEIKQKILSLFKGSYDDKGNLQLGLKFGSDADKDEALLNVRNLITEADKFEVKLKVKTILPNFKDLIKEFETLAKDIENNSESLVPKTLATSQEALDNTISTVSGYIEFIKAQNADIATAQAEAIASGNTQAAEALQDNINKNIQAINLLEGRLKTYQTQSAEAIQKAADSANIYLQISNALQTSLLDEFNAEKIKKEKETNDKIRDEKLAALNQEDKDLTAALAKREITFEEYSLKVAEISSARDAANQEANKTFLERLKTAGDKTAASVLKSQGEVFTENAKNMTGNQKIFNEAIGQTLTSFSTLAESGKATLADFGNAAAGAAFDAVSKMIPAFVAGILGSSITQLGPIAGPLAAAALTASLQLLLSTARGALGFKDGVVDLEGAGTETSDSIPAWLSRGESVITAAGTRANREELAWMNDNPGLSIRDYFADRMPIKHYSVGSDGDLIHEVRKLREETRGLGKQITRKTIVEVSGELSADSKSIKAVIEADRRRASRRGL